MHYPPAFAFNASGRIQLLVQETAEDNATQRTIGFRLPLASALAQVTKSARAYSYYEYSVSTGTQIGEPSAVPF